MDPLRRAKASVVATLLGALSDILKLELTKAGCPEHPSLDEIKEMLDGPPRTWEEVWCWNVGHAQRQVWTARQSLQAIERVIRDNEDPRNADEEDALLAALSVAGVSNDELRALSNGGTGV